MRRLPSRQRLLPPPKAGGGAWALAGFILLLAGLVWWIWKETGLAGFAMIAGFVALVSFLPDVGGRRLRRLAAGREDESICSFARDFDCRSIDTVIIRAVHAEVVGVLDPMVPDFPLRASDRFEEDLLIDDEIDDLVVIAAHRAGRSLEGWKANPLFGKVRTAGDLVQFLARQPALIPE